MQNKKPNLLRKGLIVPAPHHLICMNISIKQVKIKGIITIINTDKNQETLG
jgi:hypothetical protein